MSNRRSRARQDRVVKAKVGSKDGSSTNYTEMSYGVKLNNIGAAAQRILDNSSWASGAAVYELSALIINHPTESSADPRDCLESGISNHPRIVGDGHSYRAYMPSGSPLPDECLECVMSALLSLSGGVKDTAVRADFL